MKINNMPAYARSKKFIVVRFVDGEAWFYDAWNDVEGAIKQAAEINGNVIPAYEISEEVEVV